jgi:hypothetical protein
MTKPLVHSHYTDGRPSESREMTDEEFAEYEALIANADPLPSAE